MRKQIELKLEVGDANYVKPGEYFGVLDENNRLTAIKVREDDLTLRTLVDLPTVLESNKAVTIDFDTYTEPVVIEPTDGKDAMSKVTVTITSTQPEPDPQNVA